ncbi:MAG: hypothetical protein ABIH89_00860, partial [Elusimicrobiota bacterium]
VQKQQIHGIIKEKTQSEIAISKLQVDIDDLTKKISLLEKDYAPGIPSKTVSSIDNESMQKIEGISNELPELQEEIAVLKKSLEIQNSRLAVITEDNRKISMESKTKQHIETSSVISELDDIKRDMRKLEDDVIDQKKKLAKNSFSSSSESSIIPFWVKVSLGFSTFALFFMTR